MDFKYQFIGTTKRYLKYEPVEGQGITGNFYIDPELVSKEVPQVITITLVVD